MNFFLGSTIFENNEKRAEGIGLSMRTFHNSLHLRKSANEQAILDEVVKIDYGKVCNLTDSLNISFHHHFYFHFNIPEVR